MNYRSIFVAALMFAWAATASAQTQAIATTVDTGASGRALASRIRFPQERYATSLPITEFDFLVPLGGGAQGNGDVGLTFGSEVGWMQSIGRRDAVAVTAFGVAGADDPRLGAKLRYRHWLSRELSLDAGLGKVLTTDTKGRGNEFVGSLALSWNDRVHFLLHYENYRATEWRYIPNYSGGTLASSSHRMSDLYAGLKLGREAGIVATSAAVVGILVFLATFEMGPIM